MMKIVSMHIKEWAEMGKKGSSMYTLLFIYAIILSALNIILPDIKTVWIIIGVLFCFSILVFFYYWKKKITIHARPKVVINIVKEDLLVSKEGYMNILPFNVFFEDSLEEKFVNSNSINGKAIRLFPDLIGEITELDHINVNENRRRAGSERFYEYEVGRYIRRDNFFIIAFAKNDDKFQPMISIPEYYKFLESVCKCIDTAPEDKFMIPIFGTSVLNTENFILDLETAITNMLNFMKAYKFTKSKTIEICYFSTNKSLMKFKHDTLK